MKKLIGSEMKKEAHDYGRLEEGSSAGANDGSVSLLWNVRYIPIQRASQHLNPTILMTVVAIRSPSGRSA